MEFALLLANIEGWLPAIILALSLVGTACFVMLLVSLLSRISGWRALARAYPDPGSVEGVSSWFGSIALRWGMGYNGCVRVTANADGLRLAVWPIFSLGHPPMFLPWAEMHAEQKRMFFARWVLVRMDREPEIPVYLPEALVRGMQSGMVAEEENPAS